MADPLLPVACADDERRHDVAQAGSGFNGIDWLEVDAADQRVLHVGFLHPLPGETGGVPASPALARTNIVITGGERITNIEVESVAAAGPELTVTVGAAGDFSPYVLRVVRSAIDARPPNGFDPALSAIAFSFKANCPATGDCRRPSPAAARQLGPSVVLDYLAKDYDGFRRLMLDRLAAVLPDRTETHPADPLVTVVEMLAHVADRLSYRQDAVGTEAYLGTARSRVSVRRHARLLDYAVHDGCTARTWLHVAVDAGSPAETLGLPAGTLVLSGVTVATVAPADVDQLVAGGAVAFETLADLVPAAARNEIPIHAWGSRECCLPAGATRATLRDEPFLGLAAGDLLLLEETRDPATGRAADADPSHRQVVRLIDVIPGRDPVEGVDVVEVTWSLPDALRFPLQVTSVIAELGAAVACAVARGNLVLVDHARRVSTDLPPARAARFRPLLTGARVAAAQETPTNGPAAGALVQDPARCLPLVTLDDGEGKWEARRDLLASDRFDPGFVVEIERDGRVRLRFGDDVNGRKPAPATLFRASWRSGGGAVGNVGRDVLTRIVTDRPGVRAVTNPLPAAGGVDPESIDHVRQHAPASFVTQERAVTPEDWVEVAQRRAEVAHAAARLRWTGSWWTVFLTLDLVGGRRLGDDPVLAAALRRSLDRFRIAGYALELRDPVDVPLELRLHVRVSPGHFQSRVRQALVDAFSARELHGTRGFFHPDNFTFGQPVAVSRIVAHAAAVPGVASVLVTELHPVGVAPAGEVDAGLLTVGDLEIVRLDDDPSVPERGTLHLDLDGGL